MKTLVKEYSSVSIADRCIVADDHFLVTKKVSQVVVAILVSSGLIALAFGCLFTFAPTDVAFYDNASGGVRRVVIYGLRKVANWAAPTIFGGISALGLISFYIPYRLMKKQSEKSQLPYSQYLKRGELTTPREWIAKDLPYAHYIFHPVIIALGAIALVATYTVIGDTFLKNTEVHTSHTDLINNLNKSARVGPVYLCLGVFIFLCFGWIGMNEHYFNRSNENYYISKDKEQLQAQIQVLNQREIIVKDDLNKLEPNWLRKAVYHKILSTEEALKLYKRIERDLEKREVKEHLPEHLPRDLVYLVNEWV